MTPHYQIATELVKMKVKKRVDTHDDRSRPKHLRAGTNESILLTRRAHILDVRKHPRLHAELHRPRKDRRNNLAPEHRAGRDLHVMTELEVGGEGERLRHRNVPPG